MKFECEFYQRMTQRIVTEVIEAEDIQGAAEEAEGRATEDKTLVNIVEI